MSIEQLAQNLYNAQCNLKSAQELLASSDAKVNLCLQLVSKALNEQKRQKEQEVKQEEPTEEAPKA